MSRWPSDKGHLLAIRLRECRRGGQRVTSSCRVVIECVYLTDIRRDGVEGAIGCDHLRGHPPLPVAIGGSGNATEEAGVVVCC